MIKKPELLAPAGSLEKLKWAIDYGADAVYLGGTNYSLRANAKNFTLEEMEKGVKYAHSNNAKVYVTVNIVFHDEDVINLGSYLTSLQNIGVDAIIFSDPLVIDVAKKYAPKLELHLSTQASVLNKDACNYYVNQGVKRVVLARECSKNDIADIINNTTAEVECFIHGAMCMSYSGRCLLSNFITGRPANRGACAQLCRWKYDVILRECESGIEMPIEEDARGAYIMNSRDLCLMPRLRDVLESHPDSLKIEGRNRSEYDVGSVVHAYRCAMDAYARDPENFNPAPFMDMLNRMESRGYTTAFFDGNLGPDAHNYETTRSTSAWHAAGVITAVDDEKITLELRNEIKQGDEITFILPNIATDITVQLPQIINAQNGESVPKMSAGQNNSLIIPRQWINSADYQKFVPYVLATKKK